MSEEVSIGLAGNLRAPSRVRHLVVSVILQLCIGIYYIWGVFQEPVMTYFDWNPTKASMTFYVMIVANVLGNIIGGRIYDRTGPRFTVYTGGAFFTSGMLLSSLVPVHMPWLIYLTYGVITGFGSGIVYTTNVSSNQKWWVDKSGLASGVTVTAFGAATILFAPVVNNLLSSFGVVATFRMLAVFYAVMFGIFGMFVSDPPGGFEERLRKGSAKKENQRHYSAGEVVRMKKFYILLASLMLLIPTYYILNPIFKTLGQARGLSENLAVGGIMLTGVASASGRMVAAKMSDYIGSKRVVQSLYLIMIACVILGIFAKGIVFLLVIFFVAFAYGGSAGINPVLITDLFGTKHIGSVLGLTGIAILAAGVLSPIIAGVVSVNGNPTSWTFIVPGIACLVGLALASKL